MVIRGIPSRPVGGRARAPGMAMTASTPPAKLLHSNRRLPRKMEAATSQQMTAVSARAGVARYLCRRHWPSDSPDTMVSRAVPSCTTQIQGRLHTRHLVELQTKVHKKESNHGKGPYLVFSWLKTTTRAFTFKTL